MDPLSISVWRQLYPKHLSQSRQVGGCLNPHRDPFLQAPRLALVGAGAEHLSLGAVGVGSPGCGVSLVLC